MENNNPKKAKFSTTINTNLLNKFRKIAQDEGRNINYYIEKGLNILLEEREREFEKKKSNY